MPHYTNLKRLFAVLDRWKANYLFAGGLLIAGTFVRMLEPKILQVTIDGVVLMKGHLTKNTDIVAAQIYKILPTITADSRLLTLLYIGVLLLIIAIIKSAAMFYAMALASLSTENAVKKLRDQLFRHIQALPLPQFSLVGSGDLIQRCTGDITTVRTFIGTQVVQVIRMFAIFLAAFVMMYTTNSSYALISIMLLPLILISSVIFFIKESKIWEEHEKEQDKLTAIIQENLSGIRVVQAFANEQFEIDKFVRQNKEKLRMGMRNVRIESIFWPISDFFVNSQIAISILAGGYFLLNQQITMGEFVSFFTYSIMVTWPMREVGSVVSQAGMAAVAMNRIHEILAAKEEDYAGRCLANDQILGEIEFRNVRFRYTADGPFVLDGISFKVGAGEKIALMGAPGSGKSTIVALLARLYEPTEGEILLNGIPLDELDKKWLRKRLGIVWQKSFLFSTTVKNNIIYERIDASEQAIKEAAEAATVNDFTQKLPKGMETMVGEKGVTLSGGQKQRVTLARTLLAKPDLLILDDATSAVDTETEYRIQQALKEHLVGKTSLTIAHRLTSIQQAERIIILEKGKIAEEGTSRELLQLNGFYKKIYGLQIKVEESIAPDLGPPKCNEEGKKTDGSQNHV